MWLERTLRFACTLHFYTSNTLCTVYSLRSTCNVDVGTIVWPSVKQETKWTVLDLSNFCWRLLPLPILPFPFPSFPSPYHPQLPLSSPVHPVSLLHPFPETQLEGLGSAVDRPSTTIFGRSRQIYTIVLQRNRPLGRWRTVGQTTLHILHFYHSRRHLKAKSSANAEKPREHNVTWGKFVITRLIYFSSQPVHKI